MDEATKNDAPTITIALNGEFTARELEEIIGDLARARAGMEPPVPATIEGAAALDSPITVEESPAITFATLANGGLRIHIRSSGFGWFAVNLTPEQHAGLRNLITNDVAHTHRSH